MKRIAKELALYFLIGFIAILMMFGMQDKNQQLAAQNKTLREQNRALSERVVNLPDDFGSAGYIKAVSRDDLFIDVVGYGRFVINQDESQFLQVGDKAPSYILERGN